MHRTPPTRRVPPPQTNSPIQDGKKNEPSQKIELSRRKGFARTARSQRSTQMIQAHGAAGSDAARPGLRPSDSPPHTLSDEELPTDALPTLHVIHTTPGRSGNMDARSHLFICRPRLLLSRNPHHTFSFWRSIDWIHDRVKNGPDLEVGESSLDRPSALLAIQEGCRRLSP